MSLHITIDDDDPVDVLTEYLRRDKPFEPDEGLIRIEHGTVEVGHYWYDDEPESSDEPRRRVTEMAGDRPEIEHLYPRPRDDDDAGR